MRRDAACRYSRRYATDAEDGVAIVAGNAAGGRAARSLCFPTLLTAEGLFAYPMHTVMDSAGPIMVEPLPRRS